MSKAFLTSWATDARLSEAVLHWRRFSQSIQRSDRIGVVFHADMDGAIGAAVVRRALIDQHGVVPFILWVRTDEYDFGELRCWLSEQALDKCIILDISLATHFETMQALADRVRDSVFVFDHHLLPKPALATSKIIVVNPTPEPLQAGQVPVPTFAFALRLADELNYEFPSWLLLLAVFAEGVDSFAERETATLFQEVFKANQVANLRMSYRQSTLPKTLGYIRAAFAASPKGLAAIDAVDAVCRGEILELAQFASRLAPDWEDAAARIGQTISRAVEEWKPKIGAMEPSIRTVFILAPSADSAGPVASILRGYFPDRVIVTRADGVRNATFELRTKNGSALNLPTILAKVAARVRTINFGGHPSAAGALVPLGDADTFQNELELVLNAPGLRPER